MATDISILLPRLFDLFLHLFNVLITTFKTLMNSLG